MTATKRNSRKHETPGVLRKFENYNPPPLRRSAPNRVQRKKILIYCEGKNTEPSYFKQFRLSTATIETFGEGRNTRTLVERAIELKKEKHYDQVWCVFDGDEHGIDNFNSAITLAEKHGIKVAYSIQAFEYWLLLHYEDHQGGRLHRMEYNHKINSYTTPLGVTYDGNGSKLVSDSLFYLLMGAGVGSKINRVNLAIHRAKRNYNLFDHRSPGTEESSTTVFMLVEEIMQYI